MPELEVPDDYEPPPTAAPDPNQMKIYTTPGDQANAFKEAMSAKQIERIEEVGQDTWREYADTYGFRILYAEIASINSRLKQLFWDGDVLLHGQVERASDLLIDLGNYASFLYEAIQSEEGSKL